MLDKFLPALKSIASTPSINPNATSGMTDGFFEGNRIEIGNTSPLLMYAVIGMTGLTLIVLLFKRK